MHVHWGLRFIGMYRWIRYKKLQDDIEHLLLNAMFGLVVESSVYLERNMHMVVAMIPARFWHVMERWKGGLLP